VTFTDGTGGGLKAPQDVKDQTAGDCGIVLKATPTGFVTAPGFTANSGIFNCDPHGVLTPEALREACLHVWRDANSTVMLGGDILTSEPVSYDDKRALVALRRHIDATGRAIDLEVDGGINPETARAAIAAGADVLVAGTATFSGGASAYAANIKRLRGDGAAPKGG